MLRDLPLLFAHINVQNYQSLIDDPNEDKMRIKAIDDERSVNDCD